MHFLSLLFLLTLAQQAPPTHPSAGAPVSEAKEATPGEELGAELLKVRRIYVDAFGDDPVSKQVQAMLINSLSDSKRFVITENKDKADAVMKGSTLETASQELHSSSELTVAGRTATGDSEKSTETIHEAKIAVRLVAANGDVIWTSTQESRGAKYKSATADVADKVVKDLLYKIEKLGAKSSAP